MLREQRFVFSRSRFPSCITRVTFGLYRVNFGGHFSLVISNILLMFCCAVLEQMELFSIGKRNKKQHFSNNPVQWDKGRTVTMSRNLSLKLHTGRFVALFFLLAISSVPDLVASRSSMLPLFLHN